MYRPVLHYAEILAWADNYHERTGAWPKKNRGRIPGTLDETWLGVIARCAAGAAACQEGLRSLSF